MSRITRHLVDTRFGQLHCREAGTGPAILIAHINQQSSALQQELLAALAPGARAIAFDYPSHGMSDPIDVQPSIEDYAACGLAVLDGLGIDQAAVLGEATGAAVAIELAASHAGRVTQAVLLNCPFYRDRAHAHDVHAPLKHDLRPADASGFPLTRTLDFMRERDPGHAPLHPDQSWMDRINQAQIAVGRRRWQALDALNAYDIGHHMARIARPALLLMGEHFHYTHLIPEYRRLIPTLVDAEVVPGARFCMAWEKAEQIGARVLRFMQDQRLAPAAGGGGDRA
jgi:pimeloyl-ACP methyl ester carboxylesterase